MKWFKHISNSLNDPDIHYLIEKHGANGYLVFFGTLEVYAREFKPELNWKLVVTLSYLKQNLRQSHYKLMENCLRTISELGRFEVDIKDGKVSIFIPKFKELMDEWTQRKLGSCSAVTPKILIDEVEVRSKKEKEIKDLTTLSRPEKKSALVFDFESIWNTYPLKLGKKEAIKHFNASIVSEKDFEDIKKSLVNYQKYLKTPNSRTQKLPPAQHGSTWFNNWRDWIDYKGLELNKPLPKQPSDPSPTPPPTPLTPEEKERGEKFLAEFNRTHINKIGHPVKVSENAREAK